MSIGSTIKTILTAQGLWGAVIATVSFVAIGFFATRKGYFTKETNGRISKFIIVFILPFLCLWAFMEPAKTEHLKDLGWVIGASVVYYLVMGVISWLVVKYWPQLISKNITAKANALYEQKLAAGQIEYTKAAHREYYLDIYKQKLITSQMMIMYGSLQFFAYPLVAATTGIIFNDFAPALLQIWCIPYMIGTFSHCKLMYSTDKEQKISVKAVLKSVFSPMMIILFISLFLFLIQFAINPAVQKHLATNANAQKWLLNFWASAKGNLSALSGTVAKAVGVVSPLAWIVIGGSLAASKLKEAFKDVTVWITTARKLIVLPLVIFLITMGLVAGKLISASAGTLLVLLAATPPATVCMVYCVAYNHPHTAFTAQVSSLSTLLALVAMPLWLVISHVTFLAIAK
ncbi:AEC family transporter [Mycoplasmopsis gallinarum]